MFVSSRLLLGVGFGLKSASTAIFTSDCAPARLRGVLVLNWQLFTALGIILGYTCDATLKMVLNEIESNIHPHQLLDLDYVSNIVATAGSGLTPRTSYLRADLLKHVRVVFGQYFGEYRSQPQ